MLSNQKNVPFIKGFFPCFIRSDYQATRSERYVLAFLSRSFNCIDELSPINVATNFPNEAGGVDMERWQIRSFHSKSIQIHRDPGAPGAVVTM